MILKLHNRPVIKHKINNNSFIFLIHGYHGYFKGFTGWTLETLATSVLVSTRGQSEQANKPSSHRLSTSVTVITYF